MRSRHLQTVTQRCTLLALSLVAGAAQAQSANTGQWYGVDYTFSGNLRLDQALERRVDLVQRGELGCERRGVRLEALLQSAYAPLVELGWRHQFSPEVRMYADANGIKKNGGNINGHIYGGAVGVEWYVTPMVGVVAEYSASKISLRRPVASACLASSVSSLLPMRWPAASGCR